MEIKTTEDIMYEYVDCNEGSLNLYDINPNVKWIRIEDIIKLLDDMIESVELAGYDNPIDESYHNALLNVKDAITSDSRSSNEDSLNTDYDFGSKKEPQPKGKDASHPSHNQ